MRNNQTSPPVNTGPKQAKRDQNGQFIKGSSGNMSGRPQGRRNRATVIAQSLFDGEVEAITQKVLELALQGDSGALRLALERILPPRKDSHVYFDRLSLNQSGDVVTAIGAVLEAVSIGDLTPNEGHMIAGLIDNMRKAIDTQELERKIEHLESLINTRD